MSAPPILTVRDVRKAFGALLAVNDVSFEVAPGQVFGIAGPNGSGKSTLFNVLTGIPFGPDGGSVEFGGRQIAGLPAHKIARAGLVRSFQKDVTFGTLSAVETVRVTMASTGRSTTTEAIRLLDRVRFPADRRAEQSGALPIFDKKRLAIASGLALNPKLLLLDEPASGLTKPEIEDLAALIQVLRRDGLTLMLVEHVLPLLMAVSDTLMVMNQGRVIARGLPDAVFRDPQVIEAYLGKRAAA